jgi:AraC family transcriptional activator of pobA
VSKPNDKEAVIPVHKLQERTSAGMEIRYINSESKVDYSSLGIHRDDHYIFLVQETGYTRFNVDFKDFEMRGHAVYYIRPSQVHYIVASENARGWFLGIETSLVADEYRSVFEEFVLSQQPLLPEEGKSLQLKRCGTLLCDVFNGSEQLPLQSSIRHSLTSAFIGMIAEIYQENETTARQPYSRPQNITRQFRKALSSNYKTLKNPSDYASILCMSLSYLNESVKSATGFPVGYWIHNEIMLEARRLLYYTDLSVKEIAFLLGYEDHAYFSRLFHKIAGNSAIKFRKQYRG